MKDPIHMMHKGKIERENDKLIFKAKLFQESEEIDIEFEELFEDFEGESVEIDIFQKNSDPPKYKGGLDWTDTIESDVDPDYEFCSEKGRERFLDMKFGLMVHFGLYTHLGLLESWSVHNQSAPKYFSDIYYTMWQVFNPSEFDANEWAKLVKRAGMQFIQITTKHHEGFCLWDTKTKTKVRKRIGHKALFGVSPVVDDENHFSVMDTPFKRDIIGELSYAFHKHNLGFGIYFSHIDWNDPNFRWDEANRCYDPNYSEETHPEEWKAFIERERQQLIELFTEYGEICQVFFDGTWWTLAWDEMKKMIKELRKLQPDCMFNDRGIGPYGDFTSPERWIPKAGKDGDPKVKKEIWQVCDPIGTHWSYVPDEKYKNKHTLLHNLIDVVAKGGTYVFDQGPMPNGKFPQEAIDILEYIGRWLKVNGEAIYATRPWTHYHQGDNIYFTRSKDNKSLYAIHIGWPYNEVVLEDVSPKEDSEIYILGIDEALKWNLTEENGKKNLVISIPIEFNKKIPCDYAYSFKIMMQ